MGGKFALRTMAGLVLVASTSAACASRATTPPRQRPVTDRLVLRIDNRGGLLPPAVALTRIPQFSLFTDGLIVMEGAQIQIYPGPAIPPIFSMKVNAEGLRKIMEAARRAGLGGPDRTYEHPAVADAGTTTFTFVENGKRHVISAVALGTEPNPAIPKHEQRARAALFELEMRLGNVRSWLPEGSVSAERPFDYDGLAVVVGTEPPGEQPEQPELTWPLDRTIAELAEPVAGQPILSCFSVEGQDLEKLRPLVARANELTPWSSGGKTSWLRFRPLLPDETGCPGGPEG
ncbi:MAG TPA: hypothetical protein VGL18_14420 [Actinomycetota bacterium]